MDFRNWLISEEFFDKKYGFIGQVKRGVYENIEVPYDIYKNPSPEELDRSLKISRNINKLPGVGAETSDVAGILTDRGVVFIAPRAVADHLSLSQDLNVKIEIAFYIDQNKNLKVSEWSSPFRITHELESHPKIQAMMGQRTEYPRLAS
jgi:hypothetical protein